MICPEIEGSRACESGQYLSVHMYITDEDVAVEYTNIHPREERTYGDAPARRDLDHRGKWED